MAPPRRLSCVPWLEAAGEVAAPREAAWSGCSPESHCCAPCLKQLDSFVADIPTCRRESEICLAVVLSGWIHVVTGWWTR